MAIAVNKNDDVFVSYSSGNVASGVFVFRGGKLPGVGLALTGLVLPYGLEFDVNQNLIVVDFSSGIDSFAPPYAGAPTSTFRTHGDSDYAKLDRSASGRGHARCVPHVTENPAVYAEKSTTL